MKFKDKFEQDMEYEEQEHKDMLNDYGDDDDNER